MPTLADIYSAADSFKRRLSDAASNPSGALSQMLGYANDRARGFNELSGQAANEFVKRGGGFANQGPAGQAVDQAYMEAGQVPAITVWHGSPHIFERFDTSKIGTGEGAQAYGKGLYLAQQPEVAETYKSAADPAARSAFMHLQANKGDLNKTIKDVTKELANYEQNQQFLMPNVLENTKQKLEFLKAKKAGTPIDIGSLYKVDLPDTHIRRMLDWDAPLKDQPYPVRNLAKSLGMDMNDLGGDLIGKIGKGEEGKQMLQQAGIPGVKYFDQMSRGEQTGSRNFVVFDPNHLTILERNSQPIK